MLCRFVLWRWFFGVWCTIICSVWFSVWLFFFFCLVLVLLSFFPIGLIWSFELSCVSSMHRCMFSSVVVRRATLYLCTRYPATRGRLEAYIHPSKKPHFATFFRDLQCMHVFFCGLLYCLPVRSPPGLSSSHWAHDEAVPRLVSREYHDAVATASSA